MCWTNYTSYDKFPIKGEPRIVYKVVLLNIRNNSIVSPFTSFDYKLNKRYSIDNLGILYLDAGVIQINKEFHSFDSISNAINHVEEWKRWIPVTNPFKYIIIKCLIPKYKEKFSIFNLLKNKKRKETTIYINYKGEIVSDCIIPLEIIKY